MINNFYSNISNANLVNSCAHKQHHVPEQPYLLKNNFLGEFRTALEKAKARANLGIADSETLYWGNISGLIEDLTDIAKYINDLLAFDYNVEKNFDAGENFENIVNVRLAAITCLDYLSKYKGEGVEIADLYSKVKDILQNLYAVDTLDEIENSEGGVINDLLKDVKNLQNQVGDPNTTVAEIETNLGKVSEDVNKINETLKDINDLIAIYDSEDNALTYVKDSTVTTMVPATDEEGNPILNEYGEQEMVPLTDTKKGGLYVKDLLPQIDQLDEQINGDNGKISILLGKVDANTANISTNAEAILTLNNTTIPEINLEIAGIKEAYVSKESLGTDSPIITLDKLTSTLEKYVAIDSNASLKGITSKLDSINIDKPFNVTTNQPLDPRHYVETKEDLLKLKNVWKGMEVIVVDNSIMYICTDPELSSKDTYEAWKAADSLRIEVLTMEEFLEKKEAGTLDDSIYYYIYQDDLEWVEMPKLEDYIIDVNIINNEDGTKTYVNIYNEEAFAEALDRFRKATNVLYGQYLSAAWGEDISNRLQYKADKAELTRISDRLSDIENFFGTDNATDSSGSLQGIKNSILNIYKPAEVDPQTGEIITPASGILVDALGNIASLTDRVEKLEGDAKNYVTWLEIGEGSTIVTEDKLAEEMKKLDNYVLTDSDASLNSITSKQDTIKINKPLEVTTDKPLDSRHYVNTLPDLYKIDASTAYDGMEVIVKQDAVIYMLDDKNNITSESGWKVVGPAAIVHLSLEEFNLRKDNTNEDGTSKGLKYESGPFEGQDIPTLLSETYYFIDEGDLSVPVEPNKNDFMDENGVLNTEKYAEALEKWRKGTYYLLQQYMSASWGLDLENLVKTKASNTDLDATNRRIDDNVTAIAGLQEELDLINSYFEESEGGTIKGITDHLDAVDSALKNVYDAVNGTGLLVTTNNQIQLIKNDLYGTPTEKAKFVTWEDLGADNSEGLEGETLFVKTSTYKLDKEDAAKHFETEELVINGENPVIVKPLSDRVSVNNQPIALQDELVKTLEFDSYEEYFNWVNDYITPGYTEWSKDKNPDDWYFLIKNVDGTVLPKKNAGESDEDYAARLELFKKGMFLTAFTAEDLYEPKANAANNVANLQNQIESNDLDIATLQQDVETLNQDIVTLTEDFNTKLGAATEDYNSKFGEFTIKIKELWEPYYSVEEDTYTNLGGVALDILTKTETSLTPVLKEFTTQEVERVASSKLDVAKFEEIWDTYYTDVVTETEVPDGEPQTVTTRTYKSLVNILKDIMGEDEEGNADKLTLTSLLGLVNKRETIEKHDEDIQNVRDELAIEIGKTRSLANQLSGDAQFKATEACLNAAPITYSELKELKTLGSLVPGRLYRIIDYITTSKERNTKVIWHKFDIIVTAISNYEFSEVAYATISEIDRFDPGFTIPDDPDNNTINTGDEDEFVGGLAEEENELEQDTYYRNSNLAAWELKYCFDNDSNKYSWVDDRYWVTEPFNSYILGTILSKDEYDQLSSVNKAKCEQIGKGVIYYMKDEFGNECSYDFKSILFERFYIPNQVSERQLSEWVVNKYYSAISKTIDDYHAVIPNYNSDNVAPTLRSRFYYTFDTGRGDQGEDLTIVNANTSSNTCRDNHFAYPCNLKNALGGLVYLREDLLVLNNNVFIGNTFISNTCNEQGFSYNTILNGASNNTFGANFSFNIINTNLANNSFGNDCRNNIINSLFRYNTAGNEFLSNCIDTECENNTFRDLFYNNTLMHNNLYNVYGDSVKNSRFPDYFKNNELGGNINLLEIEETAHYMQYCYFNKGINSFQIKDSKQSSRADSWYLYIHFNWSAFSGLRVLDFSNLFLGAGADFVIRPGNKYITEILDSSLAGQGFVWCPADIVRAMIDMQTQIETLQNRCTSIEQTAAALAQTVSDNKKLFDNELKFTDAISAFVGTVAERLGMNYTAKRITT